MLTAWLVATSRRSTVEVSMVWVVEEGTGEVTEVEVLVGGGECMKRRVEEVMGIKTG